MSAAADDYIYPAPLPGDSVAKGAHATYLAMCREIDRLRATVKAHRDLEHELLDEIHRLRDIPPHPECES